MRPEQDDKLLAKQSVKAIADFMTAWKTISGLTYHDLPLFPAHLEQHELKVARQEYKSIREMFYTTSDLPVITPDNAQSFLSTMQRFKGKFCLSSYCSGSSKLSAVMLRVLNRFVMFPVDLR